MRAVEHIRDAGRAGRRGAADAAGPPVHAGGAARLSALGHVVLLCGRYEGMDERVSQLVGAEELSIGDYVLSGGEVPALAVVDAVSRLVPGVVGDQQSVDEDSFTRGLLDYPHYTRPVEFGGLKVPDVLLSGHHADVRRWRRKAAIERTLDRRPDLLDRSGSRCRGPDAAGRDPQGTRNGMDDAVRTRRHAGRRRRSHERDRAGREVATDGTAVDEAR